MKTFWNKVKKTRGCWLWTAATCGGYGRIFFKGKVCYAPRVSFELANGRSPKNQVLHTCDNTLCVRPSHLRDGTRYDNMQDAAAKGRWCKLTKKQVNEIRRNNHTIYSDLAFIYGVHKSTIYQIKANITHKGKRL